MTLPFGRQHRLVSRGGAGLTCDDDGLALGSVSIAALERGALLPRRCRSRSADEISRALRLAYEAASEATIARYREGLQRVVTLLEAGDIGRAGVHALLLGLPEISPEGMAKLAAVGDLLKGDHWEDQPRAPAGEADGGQWTSGGEGADEGAPARREQPGSYIEVSTSTVLPPTPEERRAFVRDHLAAATVGAKALGVPVENILGLAALESYWGKSRIAKVAHNFFGMQYPAFGDRGFIESEESPQGKPKVKLAVFNNFMESLNSFINKYENIVRNKTDPEEFVRLLQIYGKFGLNTSTGKPEPSYVNDVANTIRHMRKRISDLATQS